MSGKSEEVSFATVRGQRLAYLSSGAGPLVILVHGFPDTAHTWDYVRPALVQAGYRTVAPFQRGYYPSAIAEDGRYDVDSLGGDVIGLIEALGETSAIVVGHDFGASAGYAAASLAPERVRALVTLAIPHPAALKPSPALAWSVRHFVTLRLPGAAARIRRGDMQHIDELVQRWSPGWDVPLGETELVKEIFARPGVLEAALGYYRALSPKLPASHRDPIRVPTISFAGTSDLISPSVFADAARHFAADYRVVEIPGSHFMHRQYPQAFESALLEVLAPYAGDSAS